MTTKFEKRIKEIYEQYEAFKHNYIRALRKTSKILASCLLNNIPSPINE